MRRLKRRCSRARRQHAQRHAQASRCGAGGCHFGLPGLWWPSARNSEMPAVAARQYPQQQARQPGTTSSSDPRHRQQSWLASAQANGRPSASRSGHRQNESHPHCARPCHQRQRPAAPGEQPEAGRCPPQERQPVPGPYFGQRLHQQDQQPALPAAGAGKPRVAGNGGRPALRLTIRQQARRTGTSEPEYQPVGPGTKQNPRQAPGAGAAATAQ